MNDKRVSDLTGSELKEEIDKAIEEIRGKFTNKVKNEFLTIAKVELLKYKEITVEMLEEFFEYSPFMQLVENDLDYVCYYSPDYWADSIIKDIKDIIDFGKLTLIIEN